MTLSTTILKTDFNAAVTAAIPTVKTPLLAAEAAAAALGLPADHPLNVALTTLHAAHAALIVKADAMGSTGGIHAASVGISPMDGTKSNV